MKSGEMYANSHAGAKATKFEALEEGRWSYLHEGKAKRPIAS